jgi:fido (protein-threonine AMPylation protein)
MPKISLEDLPEVFVSSSTLTKNISRYLKTGKLRRLGSRLYTKNLVDPPESIIKRNLWPIVGAYFPGDLIADRTAIENKPATDGSVFLISLKKRDIKLPGITLRPRKGHPPLPNDRPFIGGLYLSSQARAFLENMKPSRAQKGLVSRTLSPHELEEQIETLLQRGGPDALNKLRDEASKLAKPLGLDKEFKQLNELIGSFLGTKNHKLQSPTGLARQFGFPYDPQRLDLFYKLWTELANSAPLSRLAPTLSPQGIANISFFEAYFSNFIEGTEFEIDEAFDIIFKGNIPPQRPADAHDILGTFKIVSNIQEMSRIPKNFDLFLTLLKERHSLIMEGRSEKLPGEFKKENNRVGSTVFVLPELVLGTLKKGFEIYQSIEVPFHRALFMMFLVAEVHPFADGNGRISRIMMNAELVASSEQRIIIPTIYRNNYLSALRALSLNKRPEPFIRMLDFAQKYTLAIDFNDFNQARLLLQKTNAFLDPNEADAQGLRLILPTSIVENL